MRSLFENACAPEPVWVDPRRPQYRYFDYRARIFREKHAREERLVRPSKPRAPSACMSFKDLHNVHERMVVTIAALAPLRSITALVATVVP
jgi:hypothetical protein